MQKFISLQECGTGTVYHVSVQHVISLKKVNSEIIVELSSGRQIATDEYSSVDELVTQLNNPDASVGDLALV